MIKFLPPDFIGVSHAILWKNGNAIYYLQIPALVPEISKFEKCVNVQINQIILIQIGWDIFFIIFDQNLVEYMMSSLG